MEQVVSESEAGFEMTGEMPKGNEAQEVVEMIIALGRRAERLLFKMASEAELSTPSYNVLRLADQKGEEGLTVSEAAAKVGIRPQALSGAVGEMVQKGLLSRDVMEEDRRARVLRITGEGKKRLEMADGFRDEVVQQVIDKVPQPAVARLILRKLEEAISKATR